MPLAQYSVAGIGVAFPILAMTAAGCMNGDYPVQLRLSILISL
jgi:hypothetical protein